MALNKCCMYCRPQRVLATSVKLLYGNISLLVYLDTHSLLGSNPDSVVLCFMLISKYFLLLSL